MTCWSHFTVKNSTTATGFTPLNHSLVTIDAYAHRRSVDSSVDMSKTLNQAPVRSTQTFVAPAQTVADHGRGRSVASAMYGKPKWSKMVLRF